MTVVTERFKSLDENYNLAMTSIKQSDPVQILNSGSNSVSSFSESLTKSISQIARNLNINKVVNDVRTAKSALESALGLKKALSTFNQVKDAIRQSRGMLKTILDQGKFSGKDLDRYINDIFSGDPILQSLLRNLEPKQKASALSNLTTGKPYPPIMNLAPGSDIPPGLTQAKVTLDQNNNNKALIDAVQAVSGNQFGTTAVDKNAILRQTVILANECYNAGMVGVMAALSKNPKITPDVLERATTIVLTEQATKGNGAAILDIAIGTDSVLDGANSPLNAMPSLITEVAQNFSVPNGSKEAQYGVVADKFVESLAAMDPNWNLSPLDGMLSIHHVTAVSGDLAKTLETKLNSHTFDPVSGLTTAFESDEDAILAAMLGQDPSVDAWMQRMSAKTVCVKLDCNC